MIKFVIEIEYVAEGLSVQIKPSREGEPSLPEGLTAAMLGPKISDLVTNTMTELQKTGGGKIVMAKGTSADAMARFEEKRREEYKENDNTD